MSKLVGEKMSIVPVTEFVPAAQEMLGELNDFDQYLLPKLRAARSAGKKRGISGLFDRIIESQLVSAKNYDRINALKRLEPAEEYRLREFAANLVNLKERAKRHSAVSPQSIDMLCDGWEEFAGLMHKALG